MYSNIFTGFKDYDMDICRNHSFVYHRIKDRGNSIYESPEIKGAFLIEKTDQSYYHQSVRVKWGEMM